MVFIGILLARLLKARTVKTQKSIVVQQTALSHTVCNEVGMGLKRYQLHNDEHDFTFVYNTPAKNDVVDPSSGIAGTRSML